MRIWTTTSTNSRFGSITVPHVPGGKCSTCCFSRRCMSILFRTDKLLAARLAPRHWRVQGRLDNTCCSTLIARWNGTAGRRWRRWRQAGTFLYYPLPPPSPLPSLNRKRERGPSVRLHRLHCNPANPEAGKGYPTSPARLQAVVICRSEIPRCPGAGRAGPPPGGYWGGRSGGGCWRPCSWRGLARTRRPS